jgi:hypothetical protein
VRTKNKREEELLNSLESNYLFPLERLRDQRNLGVAEGDDLWLDVSALGLKDDEKPETD